ncbi:MAG: hypothetical protein EOO92_00205 [Pedobacter sp.]|nr:MAG: hypothetical protein EOO92_00205 [Pedobacter sp.]
MKKKIALNVFYNLGVIISICGIVWAFKNDSYPVVALFVATAGLFLFLKVQLFKDLKNTFNDKGKGH